MLLQLGQQYVWLGCGYSLRQFRLLAPAPSALRATLSGFEVAVIACENRRQNVCSLPFGVDLDLSEAGIKALSYLVSPVYWSIVRASGPPNLDRS